MGYEDRMRAITKVAEELLPVVVIARYSSNRFTMPYRTVQMPYRTVQ
jgi:hypothetical protein